MLLANNNRICVNKHAIKTDGGVKVYKRVCKNYFASL